MIIQSHRGAGNLGPENTLEAFELAWRLGTVPEADIRVTADGVMVAFHDDDLSRVVKDASPELRKLGVESLNWCQLARLDVGAYLGAEFTGQHVPTITAVFEAMRAAPERRLYLDLKRVHLDQLAALAREFGVAERVIVAAPDPELLREWLRLAPESATLLWMGGTQERLRERLTALAGAGFAGLTQLQIHVHPAEPGAAEPFVPSPAFLRAVGQELKSRGILFQALPWGSLAARAEVYHQLLDLGVESFATDDPTVTLAAVRTYVPRRAGAP